MAKKRIIVVLPSHLRVLVMKCRMAIAVKLRRRRGQPHISDTASSSSNKNYTETRSRRDAQSFASQSLYIDEASSNKNHTGARSRRAAQSFATQSLYLDEATTIGATNKALKRTDASPSVISFLYHADDALDRLQGKKAQNKPVVKTDADSGKNYGVPVRTADPPGTKAPSARDGLSVLTLFPLGPAIQEGTEDTDEESSTNSSGYGTDPFAQTDRESFRSIISEDESIYSKRNNVPVYERASSASSNSSGNMSLYVREESLLYANFPNSFISIGGEFVDDQSFASAGVSI